MHIKRYVIHVLDLEAEYGEDVKVFDSNGKVVKTNQPSGMTGIANRIEAYEMDKMLGVSSVFTYDRLREVNNLLDSLDPNDIF